MLTMTQKTFVDEKVGALVAAFQRAGATERAVRDFQKYAAEIARGRLTLQDVLGVADEQVDALHKLAADQLNAGNAARAAELCEGFLVMSPYHVGLWRTWGAALHEVGRLAAAENAYRFTLALAPSDVIARLYLGEALLQLGRPDEGLRELDAGLTAAGSDVNLERWTSRARVLRELHTPH